MAKRTHMDEIINYKDTVINKITSSAEVMRLLSNNPEYDPELESSEDWEKHVLDHGWLDNTVQEVTAYILVDAEVLESSTGTTKDMVLYVQVLCHKDYMSLDNKTFPGLKGNRKDNLCRYIDVLINGSQQFGIGRLDLDTATLAKAPENFASRILTYSVPDYAKNRRQSCV